uniref:Uncharacterized protein n=1 Tax=Oncorhynchus kisutch TaxID=8019 RepID=A0A8C7FYS1_ONCKI
MYQRSCRILLNYKEYDYCFSNENKGRNPGLEQSAGKPLSVEEVRIKIKVTRSCTIAWNHWLGVPCREGAGTMESVEDGIRKFKPCSHTREVAAKREISLSPK